MGSGLQQQGASYVCANRWWAGNVNNLAAGITEIASNPSYFPYLNWWGNGISGYVLDKGGNPLAGATIGVKTQYSAVANMVTPNGGQQPVTTAIDGSYSIYVPDNAILAAWYPGSRPSMDVATGLVDGQTNSDNVNLH